MYPSRMRTKRPILRSMLANAMGLAGSSPMMDPPFRCWGPAWDRSCKVCAPLPSGGQTCSSFKVNDTHQPASHEITHTNRYYSARY